MMMMIMMRWTFVSNRAAEANEGRGEIIVRNPKLDEKDAPKSFTFDALTSVLS